MKNYIGCADRLTIVAPVEMTSGRMYAVKSAVGIAEADARAGEKVSFVTRAEVEYAKGAGNATTGDQAFLDLANDHIVPTFSAGFVLVGYFGADSADGETTCNVVLTGQVATTSGGDEPPQPS